MAAETPDASLSAFEIRELRRLIAVRRRADSLVVTLAGIFAAGFLALFGWMVFQTYANSTAIAVLQTEVAALQVGQRELKAGLAELRAEVRAGHSELKVEQPRR